MRQLASIQKVLKVEPIPGADQIEKLTVLGWQLVSKKGNFKEGDLVVYFEPDSLLPEKPEFEFMRKHNFRLRTIRLRGQVSQGLCLPLDILPSGVTTSEGMDLTEILGIKKYEPPIPAELSGIAKGMFPSFVPKTDETRVQILQGFLAKYEGQRCYVTEKLDGLSVTFYCKEGEFGACGRTIDFKEESNNSFWKFAKANNLPEKMKEYKRSYAIQGEIIGEGVQGNKYKLKGQKVYFYNAFDIEAHKYLSHIHFVELIAQLDLETVPFISNDYTLGTDIQELVKYATIRSKLRPEMWAEGIVIRLLEERIDQSFLTHNGRSSFKVINPEFLLKYDE